MSDVRATDALANERTFLAYLRTALAFIGFGFVIARFSLFLRETAVVMHVAEPRSGFSEAFGAGMAVAGAICAAYGAYRYVISARSLRSGAVAPLADSAAIAGAFAIVVIGVIVAFALPAIR
jgi:putative membrane protein